MSNNEINNLQVLQIKHTKQSPKTVGDLLDVLSKLPKDLKIRTFGALCEGNNFVAEADTVVITLQRMKNDRIAARPCKETEGSELILLIS